MFEGVRARGPNAFAMLGSACMQFLLFGFAASVLMLLWAAWAIRKAVRRPKRTDTLSLKQAASEPGLREEDERDEAGEP